MTQDQHVLLVASKAFTITGPCWCLVEDSDYLPDLTLKHQTACSRGMLGWMVWWTMDNPLTGTKPQCLPQRWVQVGAPLLLTSMLHYLLRNPVLAYQPAAIRLSGLVRKLRALHLQYIREGHPGGAHAQH